MSGVLVDTNVLLDVLQEDPVWFQASADALARCADQYDLYINPIIYAEVSISFQSIEKLEAALPDNCFKRSQLPWEAAFMAGKAFLQYRRAGGKRVFPLPDFFIGAHAAVAGWLLLTRDAARFQSYFPTVQLIVPGNAG